MPKKKNLNTLLIERLGVSRALYVEVFIMLWAMFRAANDGQDPQKIEELADAIGKNRATVFRWQADFREALPEYSTPGDLLDRASVAKDRAVTLRTVRKLAIP